LNSVVRKLYEKHVTKFIILFIVLNKVILFIRNKLLHRQKIYRSLILFH